MNNDTNDSKNVVRPFDKLLKAIEKDGPAIGLISSVLGIVQGLLIFAPVFKGENIPDNSVLIASFISINVVNILLIAYLIRYVGLKRDTDKLVSGKDSIIEQKDREINAIRKATAGMAKIIRNVETETACLHSVIMKSRKTKTDHSELVHSVHKYLIFFLSNVKEFYDQYTKDECTVYIALINEGNIHSKPNDPTIVPYFRDPVSYVDRKPIDLEVDTYQSHEFFPFKELRNEELPRKIFASDDCRKMPVFYDRIKNWHDFYHACLVVPIGIETRENMLNKRLGYLVIDNKNGMLDNEVCRAGAQSFSCMLFAVFENVLTLGNYIPGIEKFGGKP